MQARNNVVLSLLYVDPSLLWEEDKLFLEKLFSNITEGIENYCNEHGIKKYAIRIGYDHQKSVALPRNLFSLDRLTKLNSEDKIALAYNFISSDSSNDIDTLNQISCINKETRKEAEIMIHLNLNNEQKEKLKQFKKDYS